MYGLGDRTRLRRCCDGNTYLACRPRSTPTQLSGGGIRSHFAPHAPPRHRHSIVTTTSYVTLVCGDAPSEHTGHRTGTSTGCGSALRAPAINSRPGHTEVSCPEVAPFWQSRTTLTDDATTLENTLQSVDEKKLFGEYDERGHSLFVDSIIFHISVLLILKSR